MTTSISWCDETWVPVTGCTRLKLGGCDNCYAFTVHDQRHVAQGKAAKKALIEAGVPQVGNFSHRNAIVRARELGLKLPMAPQYDRPFSEVQTLAQRLDAPLHWKKPRRIFVTSMGDLFHEDVPDEFLDQVFAVMALTPHHSYQVLTKRPERMREYLSERTAHPCRLEACRVNADGCCNAPDRDGKLCRGCGGTLWLPCACPACRRDSSGSYRALFPDIGNEYWAREWPLSNVWLGTSVENQAAADERIPHLLATPAAVRFLSCEPLLGPVDLRSLAVPPTLDGINGLYTRVEPLTGRSTDMGRPCPNAGRIDWVIVGGESGPRFRPMELEWALDLKRQCDATGVAVWCKQGSGRKSEQPFGHPELDGARAFPAGGA